jgi:threonine dehydrogenase-like Zn-dependent dehydrogenase
MGAGRVLAVDGVEDRLAAAKHLDLVALVRTGAVMPSVVLTQVENIEDAIDACRCFDKRESGWMKMELAPAG